MFNLQPEFHQIQLRPSAARSLGSFDRDVRAHVAAAIVALFHDPRPPGCVRLDQGQYRLRVGEQRIVYEIEAQLHTITVTVIRGRRELYR